MAIDFLPTAILCESKFCPVQIAAAYGIFIYDFIRAGLWIYDYTSVPLCQNYPRVEGFGLFMRNYSCVLMVLALIRVLVMFVILLGLYLDRLDTWLFTDSYVVTTFILVLMTIFYFMLYFVLVVLAGFICYTNHIIKVVPSFEGIKEGFKPTHVSWYEYGTWVVPVCLFFSILEGALLIYFAIVVNSIENNLEIGQGVIID